MRYLIAIFLPPLGILLCGNRVGTAFFNCFLCLLLWIPGIIHAWLVISGAKADERMAKLAKELNAARGPGG